MESESAMTDLLKILQNRRSIRSYTGEPIPEPILTQILQAGLLSASSRSIRPWELIVVRDKETLAALAESRVRSAAMLQGADAAIVVVADAERSDTWIEDSAIVLSNMHLMADSLGVGSCWIQGRLREAPDGRLTDDVVRERLGYPEHMKLAGILSLGMPQEKKSCTELNALHTEKIHYETY